jgi:hypothetical protein
MTYDVRETPEEVIHTALCCAEGEAAIDEVDVRAAREWLVELIAARDTALALAEQRLQQNKRILSDYSWLLACAVSVIDGATKRKDIYYSKDAGLYALNELKTACEKILTSYVAAASLRGAGAPEREASDGQS